MDVTKTSEELDVLLVQLDAARKEGEAQRKRAAAVEAVLSSAQQQHQHRHHPPPNVDTTHSTRGHPLFEGAPSPPPSATPAMPLSSRLQLQQQQQPSQQRTQNLLSDGNTGPRGSYGDGGGGSRGGFAEVGRSFETEVEFQRSAQQQPHQQQQRQRLSLGSSEHGAQEQLPGSHSQGGDEVEMDFAQSDGSQQLRRRQEQQQQHEPDATDIEVDDVLAALHIVRNTPVTLPGAALGMGEAWRGGGEGRQAGVAKALAFQSPAPPARWVTQRCSLQP